MESRKLKAVVTITKDISYWADDDFFYTATDEDVINLLKEDICEVVEDAEWKVKVTKI